MSTDRDWEKWGALDPYFGVLSTDRFRREHFTVDAREEFFASGARHVDEILATVRRVFQPDFKPAATLDFGCGVGRLLVPFARLGSRVVGVDVSPPMLIEARANCDARNLHNVALIHARELATFGEDFDLVHSCLVFQHVPWSKGRGLLESLLALVRPGGYVAVQFYHRCTAPWMVQALVRTRYHLPMANWLRNLWRGRPYSEPAMQLHVYDLTSILRSLRLAGFAEMWQSLGSAGNGQFESIMLIARRAPAASDL